MHDNDAIYTKSERTDRKYTVGFAVASAKRQLKQKRFRGGMCVDALRRHSLSDKITLQQVNEIAGAIVSDSLYYDSGW